MDGRRKEEREGGGKMLARAKRPRGLSRSTGAGQPRVDGRVVLFFIGARFCFADENSFFLRAAYF